MFLKYSPMTGFELQTSGIGSNRSANWATTKQLYFYVLKIVMYVDRLKGNILELCFPVVFDSSISFIHPFVFFYFIIADKIETKGGQDTVWPDLAKYSKSWAIFVGLFTIWRNFWIYFCKFCLPLGKFSLM